MLCHQASSRFICIVAGHEIGVECGTIEQYIVEGLNWQAKDDWGEALVANYCLRSRGEGGGEGRHNFDQYGRTGSSYCIYGIKKGNIKTIQI